MTFVAFDFRGLYLYFNHSFLFFVNLLVVVDFDIIIHANGYTKLLKHISQIAAVLLEGEAGLSIAVFCTYICNLWRFDDPNLGPATSNDLPANTVPALSCKINGL